MDRDTIILTIQRPRKVRVWYTFGAQMVYDPFLVRDRGGWEFYETREDAESNNSHMCIPMDFTGRQDCEGKDIYEGDRLAWGERPAGMVYWNMDRSAWYVFQFANQISVSLEVFLSGKLPFRVYGNVFEAMPEAKK